jgi:hypothetical protein
MAPVGRLTEISAASRALTIVRGMGGRRVTLARSKDDSQFSAESVLLPVPRAAWPMAPRDF